MGWRMVAHGNWVCGEWKARRYISGGWMLSKGDMDGYWYPSLVECQRVVKIKGKR